MFIKTIFGSLSSSYINPLICTFIRKFVTQATDIIETKIAVNGKQINYLKTGSGNHNVFCLPGSMGTIWTDFSPQIVGFDLNKFSMIVWDPPGYGKSRPPERNFTVDYLEKDADLAIALLKKLNIDKYSLLGWSDGGITALILAAKYPDMVRNLVVWGANAYVLDEDIKAYKKIKNIENWSVGMRNTMIAIYGETELQNLMDRWFDCMNEILKSRDGDICRESVPKIVAPTLILHGAQDPLVPSYHYHFLHRSVKNSKLHIIQDGKHNIHLKFAEFFNRLVQHFLLEDEIK